MTGECVFDARPKALETADGHAGVELYRAEWQRIDLVIIDMVMPRLGGRDAFRAMKKITPQVRDVRRCHRCWLDRYVGHFLNAGPAESGPPEGRVDLTTCAGEFGLAEKWRSSAGLRLNAVARRVPRRSGVRRPVPGRGPRAGTAPSTLLRSRRSRATAHNRSRAYPGTHCAVFSLCRFARTCRDLTAAAPGQPARTRALQGTVFSMNADAFISEFCPVGGRVPRDPRWGAGRCGSRTRTRRLCRRGA